MDPVVTLFDDLLQLCLLVMLFLDILYTLFGEPFYWRNCLRFFRSISSQNWLHHHVKCTYRTDFSIFQGKAPTPILTPALPTKCKSSTLKLCLILKMHRYFLISAFLKRDWFCSLKILLSISTAPTGTSWNKVGVLFCQKGKCIGTYLKHIIPEILLKFLIGLLYENMFYISFKTNNCSNLKQFAFNLKCLGLLGSITINLMLSPEVRR